MSRSTQSSFRCHYPRPWACCSVRSAWPAASGASSRQCSARGSTCTPAGAEEPTSPGGFDYLRAHKELRQRRITGQTLASSAASEAQMLPWVRSRPHTDAQVRLSFDLSGYTPADADAVFPGDSTFGTEGTRPAG